MRSMFLCWSFRYVLLLLERAATVVLRQHVGVLHQSQQIHLGTLRSMAMPRLLRFSVMKGAETPLTRGSR